MLKPPITIALVLATTTTVAAEPREHAEHATKSEATARSLSLYGMLASAAAFGVGLAFDRTGSPAAGGLVLAGGAGLLVTPSLGHWYAKHYLSTGLVIRLAGTAGVAYGLQQAFDDRRFGAEIAIASLGVVVVGAIVDVATTQTAVRRHNERLRLAPMTVTTPSGTATGFAVAGTF